MKYIIGTILGAIILLGISFFVKRKFFSEIDQLESWKIEVMNRPVLDEVTKIKQLNMSGETEQYFERWRKTWDEVVTVDLPEVEELLFDAEEYVEKFRFKKAKDTFVQIEDTLKKAETKIDEMIKELNKIIESEAQNRQDFLDLQDTFKLLKKNLLAHRHVFGKSASHLERLLSYVSDQFEMYQKESEQGNYLTAREILLDTKEKLQNIEKKMEMIPLLINDCEHNIPSQLKEIKDGISEMEKEGYYLEHIGLDKELAKIEKQLNHYQELIEKTEVDECSSGIEDIKDSLNLMYDLLEAEVHSKQFIQKNEEPTVKRIDQLIEETRSLQEEVTDVKSAYHLSDADENLTKQLEERLLTMKKTIAILSGEAQPKSAYSAIREKLEGIIGELEEIEKEQQKFKEKLQTLRKDEIDAREKIKELKYLVQETKRLISRSNVPGIPLHIETLFLEATESVEDCFVQLEKKPLVMTAVQQTLKKAEEVVNQLHQQVNEMVENVFFIEKIIQYGNRYRSQHPEIHKQLLSAEDAFRRYDYGQALEEAASAVESVEPGALKKIEAIINEEINGDK
ncbi:septation ring formation regulator EzrA [Fervidibacillus halotolerans]|uniref:Septation ring formation regulator EzrA n=1 Tax=Fervidibacillus halotolerans TaxID=2980027 RepID=A0A9E8LXW2_9BACI|nr:septation ring formation regulator EzrA [Fervidibacillus halotolerans]WAA11697.1 septation ring formation regulator EzrA [Fervidibacillus halotolerans]